MRGKDGVGKMIFDIIVLCVLGVSAVIACLRGVIREALTVMGVVGGAVAAYMFGRTLSPVFLNWFGGEKAEDLFGMIPTTLAADVAAYGAIFLVVVIVLSVVSHLLSGWAKAIGLGAVDRTFGVLFGVARGAVVLVLLYLPIFMVFDKETRDEWFKDSKTVPHLERGAAWAKGLVPDETQEEMKKKAGKAADQAAERAVRDARERLLNVEGLRDEPAADGEATDAEPPPLTAPQGTPVPPPAENGQGYETQERRDMNELFMDNTVND